ncbi:viperin family antiviral radical SAM protein [Plebeiibacterium sediminum]|uniref:S-adenosylmethionine-dependent nucleotide dehydratase n=1 Tax=Plebeiibacterium sediminum TaxID=2992112 RepID=A0AAE3SGV4_9BACT|nr:viperin family antiviral radical SAM protein [Plebeiobacterium sediminum]MCW3788507.1 viperin family antiviral radical SAM protein [Plebeiobacterium sediminum]
MNKLVNAIEIIPSVNFHLWEPCNMNCGFCFATFQDVKSSILPKGHLPKEKAIEIVKQLAGFGFEKITFAGGEPTLCPWLPELIILAKELGMTTMIISNGTKLSDDFLKKNKKHLDWIGLSIDSLNEFTNIKIGRALQGKRPLLREHYYSLIERIRVNNYKLKLNTVINIFNYNESFVDFIEFAKPKRWKVMQVLPIEGQNDNKVDEYLISNKEFDLFLGKHKHINGLVSEDNSQMISSYAMIDPSGSFFENSSGRHKYSLPILEVGVQDAYNSMKYNYGKFLERGGIYDSLMKQE